MDPAEIWQTRQQEHAAALKMEEQGRLGDVQFEDFVPFGLLVPVVVHANSSSADMLRDAATFMRDTGMSS